MSDYSPDIIALCKAIVATANRDYIKCIRNGANVRLNKSYHRKRKRKEAPVCLA